MATIEKVLTDHHMRYPDMEPIDIVKLMHQNSFGPAHFSGSVSIDSAIRRIEDECKNMMVYSKTPDVEPIGGGYVRVSLATITKNLISSTALAEAFVASMRHCVPREIARELVECRLETVVALLAAQRLPPMERAKNVISNYFESGCRPTHHSETYRKLYHPHYRVIHERDLRGLQLYLYERSDE